MKFINENSEDLRIKESNKIILKYPTRVPIIVEKYKDSQLKDIDQSLEVINNG